MTNFAATIPVAGRAGSGSPPDLFGRLEERVVQLVERYREAQKALEELDRRLQEAEARASRLEAELAERDQVREEMRLRLDRIIESVRALEASSRDGDADSEPGSDGDEDLDEGDGSDSLRSGSLGSGSLDADDGGLQGELPLVGRA